MAKTYTIIREGSDEYNLLQQIIEKNETQQHLKEAKICLLFADQDMRSKGKRRLGHARKATGFEKLFCGYDFIITLNYLWWRLARPQQKRALLDHELCHCGVVRDKKGQLKIDKETGKVQFEMRKHDYEEFHEIIERHGAVLSEAAAHAESMEKAKQLKLPFGEEKAKPATAKKTAKKRKAG